MRCRRQVHRPQDRCSIASLRAAICAASKCSNALWQPTVELRWRRIQHRGSATSEFRAPVLWQFPGEQRAHHRLQNSGRSSNITYPPVTSIAPPGATASPTAPGTSAGQVDVVADARDPSFPSYTAPAMELPDPRNRYLCRPQCEASETIVRDVRVEEKSHPRRWRKCEAEHAHRPTVDPHLVRRRRARVGQFAINSWMVKSQFQSIPGGIIVIFQSSNARPWNT